MSLHETQDFLARIYTDENLRREFLAAPEKIGADHRLTAEEISEIIEIFPDEINAFAESLVSKRRRAVEKLLPLTRGQLGGAFETHFRRFAPTFNSSSIKKHLEDALRFGDYLQTVETVDGLIKNTAKYECAQLEFYALNKNPVVRFFSFDMDTGARKNHLKIWLRIGKKELVF